MKMFICFINAVLMILVFLMHFQHPSIVGSVALFVSGLGFGTSAGPLLFKH